jgi:hypothetical protein
VEPCGAFATGVPERVCATARVWARRVPGRVATARLALAARATVTAFARTATGFGFALTTSFRRTWSTCAPPPTPGHEPKATSVLTSANSATDAISITVAVPALAM